MSNGPAFWNHILGTINHGSIIAGGCIKDWLLGLEPKDIDVFMKYNPNLKMILPENWEYGPQTDYQDYGNMSDIKQISNYIVDGQDVQIIVIDKDPVDYVKQFDLGLSQGWWDYAGLHMTYDFCTDLENQTVTNLGDWQSNDRARRYAEKLGKDWEAVLIDRPQNQFLGNVFAADGIAWQGVQIHNPAAPVPVPEPQWQVIDVAPAVRAPVGAW